jgi:hypothetical protein
MVSWVWVVLIDREREREKETWRAAIVLGFVVN